MFNVYNSYGFYSKIYNELRNFKIEIIKQMVKNEKKIV